MSKVIHVKLAVLMLLLLAALTQRGLANALAVQKRQTVYTCAMHPEVRSNSAGKCPKCGMRLQPVKNTAPKETAENSPKGNDATNSRTGSLAIHIPDIEVVDQNGSKLHFYSDLVKGKTVAINFIFTTCTTICPPLTATFRKVQQELGARKGRDVELISISVDPETDVPERLKAFADKFGAQPGWTFVTGNSREIDVLLRALNASVADKNAHTGMILVGNDPAGYWTRTYGLAAASTITKMVNDVADMESPESAKKTSPQPSADSSKSEAPKPKTASEAAAGYFPDLLLTTQNDTPVRFYTDTMKGKVVVIDFLFTTCTGACPLMTANLAKVQKYLGEHMGREVNFISLTVDPAVDTPEALKKYADQFHVGNGWYFLTGKKENVDWVLYKLGGYVEDKGDHSTLLIIGNEATGQWMKMFAMSKPEEIANAVLEMISQKKHQQ